MSRLTQCIVLLAVIRIHALAAAVREENDNEVVKVVDSELETEADQMSKTIKPKELEAFYYSMYGDIDHGSIWREGRIGDINISDSCQHVRHVPRKLRHAVHFRPRGISSFYQKYTEAYGIPVIGSNSVSDAAISRACYVLRFLLADRSDLREAYFRSYGRVAIIAKDGALRTIPEYHFLPQVYDEATPGLGAIPFAPISSTKENNVRCWRNDTYGREDILIREIGQGIFHLAVNYLNLGRMQEVLDDLYNRAMASNWWRNTYAELTPASYFGEGLQSYYNVNGYSYFPNGEHNEISTRIKLRQYDPELFMLIHQLWPCGNHYIKRCHSRGSEFYQRLNTDCPLGKYYMRMYKSS